MPSWGALADDAVVSFLPMERVWTDRLDMSETRAKEEVASGYTRFAENDILLPKITPTFEAGRAAIAHPLPGGIGAGTTELHVLRPRPEVYPRWLLHFLNNETFLRRGHADMYGVAGQKRISEEFVKNYPVSLPPLEEQRRITEYLDAETARIDELIADRTPRFDFCGNASTFR
ncbi:MAG TPA: restriction endonuclease subunit S [Acidimicrobiales bacterium]|nr:restriction endonuclease subunit S [Acidimicrobiales bacterium]